MGKAYLGGRKTGGYSLRESLTSQGVTSEGAIREHLSFVHNTLTANPTMDITRYRVSPNFPNAAPTMMG